jgi:hypothetical protein
LRPPNHHSRETYRNRFKHLPVVLVSRAFQLCISEFTMNKWYALLAVASAGTLFAVLTPNSVVQSDFDDLNASPNAYHPDDFLSLDLQRAILSPQPLGPPNHFVPVPGSGSGALIGATSRHITVETVHRARQKEGAPLRRRHPLRVTPLTQTKPVVPTLPDHKSVLY